MIKTFWFDTETTGVKPEENSIIQISGLVVIDGVLKDEFDFKCRPLDNTQIESAALEVHGYTEEEIKNWPDPEEVRKNLCGVMDNYVDRFKKTDKFIIAGYNVGFDFNMLNAFFQKLGDKYLGAYLDFKCKLDLLPFVNMLKVLGYIDIENSKLSTVCDYFGIEIQAHDALSDIKATRNLFRKLRSYIREPERGWPMR